MTGTMGVALLENSTEFRIRLDISQSSSLLPFVLQYRGDASDLDQFRPVKLGLTSGTHNSHFIELSFAQNINNNFTKKYNRFPRARF